MSEPLPYGVLSRHLLGDGRLIDVTPLTFGRARLHIGPVASGADARLLTLGQHLDRLIDAVPDLEER